VPKGNIKINPVRRHVIHVLLALFRRMKELQVVIIAMLASMKATRLAAKIVMLVNILLLVLRHVHLVLLDIIIRN
jgi:hypothetical protein